LGILVVFTTLVLTLQGCRGRRRVAERSASPGGPAGRARPGATPPTLAGRSGPLRVLLVDTEPQTLSADGDLWGARLARLVMDPVLSCEADGPQATTVDGRTPGRLYLRPRQGVPARDVAMAIEAARGRRGRGELDDIDRMETKRGIVGLHVRRPSGQLEKALCDVLVPGSGAFRADGSSGRGRPLTLARVRGAGVPAIVVLVEPDPVRAIVRLRHGEADLFARLPESYWPEQAEAPATRRAFIAVRVATGRLSYLVWNLRHATVADPDVRLALSEVLDRQRLARELHRGLAEPAAPGLAYDVRDAAARLARAGWLDHDGAVRTREGRLLRLTVLASREGHAAGLVAAWRAALRRVGAEIDVSAAEGGGFLARLREGSFDVALCERPTPPGRDLGPLFSAHGLENFGGLRDPAVDAALAAFRAGEGEEAAVWQAVLAQGAITPLFRRFEVALVSRALGGVRPSAGWLDLSDAAWRASDEADRMQAP
jgi:hypothetical protein